jgi:two-component system, cell cycle response regulator
VSRILIADDDPVSLKLLNSLLLKLNHNVVAVSDGRKAQRELQRENAPQLAILDWMMPGLDGVTLVKEIRARKKSSYTYILLLSSKTDLKDIFEGLRAGANDYLRKPIDPQHLKARLLVAERILAMHQRFERLG